MEVIKNDHRLKFEPNWNLETKIGRGGFGFVFKETGPNGNLWAVKRVSKHDPRIENDDLIIREITTSALLMEQEVT